MNDWFTFSYAFAGFACGLFLLFEGTRRMRAKGLHRKAALIAGIGAFACLAYVVGSLWFHSVLDSIVHRQTNYIVPMEMLDSWGANMTPEEREEHSLTLARARFDKTGTFRDYFDRYGLGKRYSPTEKDIKDRDILLASQVQFDIAARVSRRDGVVLLALMLAAIVGGFWAARAGGVRGVIGDAHE
jgi:hypothetical protein